jgi:nucleotide-binding universal stress UspA family protein
MGRSLAWWSAGPDLERVLKKTPCSVLCMRGRPVGEREWKRPRFKHILLLAELTSLSSGALPKVLPLVRKFDSMLHVLPLHHGRLFHSIDELPSSTVERLNAPQTNVLLFAETSRPMRNLLHFVKQTSIDLIVMSRLARARFSTPLFNDVLVKLLQVTDIPILVLR